MLILERRRASYIQRYIVYRRENGRCHYCGVTIVFERFHADHIKPWSRGGSTTINNLVASCYMCNIAKHTMNYLVFKALLDEKGLDWRRQRFFAINAAYSKSAL